MDVDVIVPQFNQSAYTEALIASIASSGDKPRVILVDNGSAAEEKERAIKALQQSGLDHLVIANESNEGFVRAVNAGLKLTTAAFITIQNNDTVVYEDCYSRMAAVLARDHGIGIVGPLSDGCCSAQQPSVMARRHPALWSPAVVAGFDGASTRKKAEIARKTFDGQLLRLETLSFFCAMLSRKTLETVGFLDEQYGVGFADDDDYCLRARRLHFGLAVALDVYVHHAHRTTFKAIYTREEIGLMQKANTALFRRKFAKS